MIIFFLNIKKLYSKLKYYNKKRYKKKNKKK